MPVVASAPAVASAFSSVPAVVWSGVIGALVAALVSFFTTLLSNRASMQRLREQHLRDDRQATAQREHDARQKNEDRKAAIRREIYGKAVEDTHALFAATGVLVDRPLGTEGDSDALQAFLKSNAKIWLVADAPAACLSRELASTMSEYFLAALVASMPVRAALEPVRQFDRRIAHAEEDLRALDVEARLAVADRNDERLKALSASKQWIADSLETMRRNRQAIVEEAIPLRQKCLESTFEQLDATQRLMVKLVSALRAELHLESNEAEFLRLLDDMKERARTAMQRIFALAKGGADKPSTIDA